MHIAAASQGCGDGVEGGAFDRLVVVFCNNECGHFGYSFERQA
jgi:hypothetical protein